MSKHFKTMAFLLFALSCGWISHAQAQENATDNVFVSKKEDGRVLQLPPRHQVPDTLLTSQKDDLNSNIIILDDFDMPDMTTPPFGNNEIGEATMTIEELKEKYASTISKSTAEQVVERTIIEGVVVANDESGNVYKQFVINDATGAIIVGVNDVGLYATLPKGQRVRILCDNLYVGGYGKLAQIGTLYNGSVGRMNKFLFPKHIRLIDKPDTTQAEMEPLVIDESFFTEENKEKLSRYVRLENVTIKEADGTMTWAPEELKNSSNVVERHIRIGSTDIILLMSTYADFAKEVIPSGTLNINGVLTHFNNYWQFMISSTDDIEQIK